MHASTIAYRGRALLIGGPSGSGKSSLAMQLIGLGATLVADDRTMLRRSGPHLLASPPHTIAGLIEVRGVGLLRLPHVDDAPVAGTVDLSTHEDERLPPPRTTMLLGVTLPLYRHVEGPHFAASLLFCLTGARRDP